MMPFFVLHPVVGSERETEFGETPPVHLGAAPECPKCGSFVGSKPWLPPYRAIVKGHGHELGDVAFGVGSSLLVSEALRRAWETAGLRGIVRFAELDELQVRPAKLASNPVRFFQASVEYGTTSVDEQKSIIDRSGAVKCQQCKTGGVLRSIHGFSIDEGTWDGQDLFYAWGLPGTIIVTDAVRQLASRLALKNVNLTAVEDYTRNPLGSRMA
jgi:hypothetical protein